MTPIESLLDRAVKAEVRAAEAEKALRNVMMLAAIRKHRGSFFTSDADHLLRFCAEVGIVPSITRVEATP